MQTKQPRDSCDSQDIYKKLTFMFAIRLVVWMCSQSFIQCQSFGLCLITAAECDTRLSQVANVTFLLPHTKHVTINCGTAMSLLMCSAMLASLLSFGPVQVITYSDQLPY